MRVRVPAVLLSILLLYACRALAATPDHAEHTHDARPTDNADHHAGHSADSGAAATETRARLAAYDLDALYATALKACPQRKLVCYERLFHDLTVKHGPRAPIELFAKLLAADAVAEPSDGHHVAHHVGHHAAAALGLSAEVYALCPATFNYGCQHGLFQYALGEGRGGIDAAARICQDLENDPTASIKDRAYCYHGLGHGVMGHLDFDLLKSLDACDRLPTDLAVQGCWQGAFMENVNQAQTGNAPKGLFSTADALAPCNVVGEKYRHECFINHAGILIRLNQDDVIRATRACLAAPEPHVSTCLESIGLMVTNPEWQSSLLRSDEQSGFLDNAWALCGKFPAGHVADCVRAAVDNILNFDGLDVRRANLFCDLGDTAYRRACHHRIGENLRALSADPEIRAQGCAAPQQPDRDACVSGLLSQPFSDSGRL
jgi:hypothetical protein